MHFNGARDVELGLSKRKSSAAYAEMAERQGLAWFKAFQRRFLIEVI